VDPDGDEQHGAGETPADIPANAEPVERGVESFGAGELIEEHRGQAFGAQSADQVGKRPAVGAGQVVIEVGMADEEEAVVDGGDAGNRVAVVDDEPSPRVKQPGNGGGPGLEIRKCIECAPR